jgi:hypothetical protein
MDSQRRLSGYRWMTIVVFGESLGTDFVLLSPQYVRLGVISTTVVQRTASGQIHEYICPAPIATRHKNIGNVAARVPHDRRFMESRHRVDLPGFFGPIPAGACSTRFNDLESWANAHTFAMTSEPNYAAR